MLTNEQRETLTEIINAGVSKAGTVLSELVGLPGADAGAMVGVTNFTDLHDCLGIDNDIHLVSVCQQFHGGWMAMHFCFSRSRTAAPLLYV